MANSRQMRSTVSCAQPQARSAQLPHLLGNSTGAPGQRGQRGPLKKNAKATPTCQSQAGQAAACNSKGAISMLQEFVQCPHSFQVSSNYSVLQWSFESQMADAATLEFRAIVAFLLEGVPHHIAGTWQPKKKDAQRDAAERALVLFAGKWSQQIQQVSKRYSTFEQLIPQQSEEDVLNEHCRHSDACGGIAPTWSESWDGDLCRTTIKMSLLDVPHQFAGTGRTTAAGARADVARRVLWYLQVPGFQDAYEPDPSAPAIVTRKIPTPPANWAPDSVAEGALEVAERKTAIMRIQNRLQQTFSHQLKPGFGVWEWSYEVDPNDESWPVLCRATVSIPVVDKTFKGLWVRGQRDAQLDTVRQVTSFLDELETKA